MKPTAGSSFAQDAAHVPSEALATARGSKARHILLAEDSEDIQRLIAAYLERTPHQLDIVADGRAAVAKFCSGHFDLVLMDVQMPVMDGYTAARKIRQWEKQRAIRPVTILALTGGGPEQEEPACDGWLSKPIRMDTLLAAIEPYLGPGDPCPPALEIQPLVPQYLEDRQEEVRQLIAALDRADYDTIRVLAHNLKSSGTPYGFAVLTDIGRSLELAAEAASFADVWLQIAALADQLKREAVAR
jgi:CheY-like chemotaxis protein